MSKTIPEASASSTPSVNRGQGSESIWARLGNDFSIRPRFYATVLLVVALAVAAFMIWRQFSAQSTANAQAKAYTALTDMMSEPEASTRLTKLMDIESTLKGTDQEPWYWWSRAQTAKAVADAATTPEEKLKAFRSAADACSVLESRFSKTPWVQLPWRSTHGPRDQADQPIPSLVTKLRTHSEAQIKWLQALDTKQLTPTTDSAFHADLVLSVDGVDHTLKLKTYSQFAPLEVENLARLATYFEGTHVFAIQQDDENTNTNHAVVLGSPLSKLAPTRSDLHGGTTDWVGFTLPSRATPLTLKRGSIGWGVRYENNIPVGLDPTRLVIYLNSEARTSQNLGLFGEIEGSEDALKALDAMLPVVDVDGETRTKKVLASAPSMLRWLVPEKLAAVKSLVVTGTPDRAPAVPNTAEIVLPEKPADLPKEEGQPKESNPESGK